jgi:hypothetical protein
VSSLAGCDLTGQQGTRKPTPRSEPVVRSKNILTGPTLLEMSGYAVYEAREFSRERTLN